MKHKKHKRPFMQMYARANFANAGIHELVVFAWLKERDPSWVSQNVWGHSLMDNWHPLKRVCIEVDGGYHKEKFRQKKDGERDAAMSMAGIRVLRITNEEVDSGEWYCKISELMGYEWIMEDFYKPIWKSPNE